MKLNYRATPWREARKNPTYRLLANLWSETNGADVLKMSRNFVWRVRVFLGTTLTLAFSIPAMELLEVYLGQDITWYWITLVAILIGVVILNMCGLLTSGQRESETEARFTNALEDFNYTFVVIEHPDTALSPEMWTNKIILHAACLARMVRIARTILQSETNGGNAREARKLMSGLSNALTPFGLADDWKTYFNQAAKQLDGDDYVI